MVRPDDGPAYPWGSQPWPGTADDVTKDPNSYHYDKPGFETALSQLKNVRKALGEPLAPGAAPPSKKTTPADHLASAGDIQATDFGSWVAGTDLYGNAKVANDLMVGGYTYFLKAFDAVIERLDSTNKYNTGAEADNVQIIDMVNVDTIDPGQPVIPPTVTNGGQ
jgi:hypothetical protein